MPHPSPRRRDPSHARTPAVRLLAWLAVCGVGALAPQTLGQASSPVFVDDSPRAADGLVRAAELAGVGNLDEASRVLQSLLNSEAERLLPREGDPDLFLTVRTRVHEALLRNPALLARYRELESAAADRLLLDGKLAELERTRLLTSAGFEAGLRLAQQALESARFESALSMLALLDRHPDRAGAGASQALELLELVAAYLPEDRSADRRARWRADAGLPAGPAHSPAASPELPDEFDVFDPAPAVTLDGMLPRPLWSDSLGDRLPFSPAGSQRAAPDTPESARWLFAVPTVCGDTVYVNDSQTITAWNRFTLSQKWRVAFPLPSGRTFVVGNQGGFEELAAVAADGVHVAAVLGVSLQSQTVPERRLVCLDALTGKVRWTRTLAELGRPVSDESSFRGPALLDQGVIVVVAQLDDSNRRLERAVVIGLDAWTGELLWETPLASNGAPAFGVNEALVDAPTIHHGVWYGVDSVGTVSAVETTTGRVKWIRRLVAPALGTAADRSPWQSNTPVIAGGNLYCVSPDRQSLLKLDPQTGAVLARMPATKLDNPDYLLEAAGLLVGVNPGSMVSLAPDDFGSDASGKRFARFQGGALRGRVLVVGDRVLAATLRGVQLFDPASEAGQPLAAIDFDKPGNVLALESQFVVVDDREIHTYLLWENAERMLRERMQSETADAGAAVTYAELSHRAGKAQGILPAVDRALELIERDPLAAENGANQSRLFRAIFEMVEPSAQGPRGAPLDLALRGQLLERLDHCASSAAERVAYLLASGSFSDATGEPAKAVEAYQTVLDDPELAEAPFLLGDTTVSADFEATRRLRRTIQIHGVALYVAYDADAERLLADAAQNLDPLAFEAIARRYPVSRAAVTAWMNAAQRHATQGKPKLAGRALEEGVAAAAHALAPEDPLVSELTGRLVKHQLSIGLVHPARALLASFVREHPASMLSAQGQTLDPQALLAEVEQRLAALARRPDIGPSPTASAQIVGWAVATPVSENPPGAPTDRVVMRSSAGELALWKLSPTGVLERAWGGVTGEHLLWMDAQGVYFIRPEGEGDALDYALIRRDHATGQVQWESRAFRAHFQPGPVERALAGDFPDGLPRIDTPLRPGIPITNLTVAFDQQTLVVADRVGRVLAIDLASGRELWKTDAACPRVFSVALEAGTLLIGGSLSPVVFEPRDENEDSADAQQAVIVAFDARGGQELLRYKPRSRVRWVKLSPEGFPVAGLDSGIISLDTQRGLVRWRAAGKDLRDSLAGWVLPGRILVRSEDNELWQLSTLDGSLPEGHLDSRGKLEDEFGTARVASYGEGASLQTRLGLAIFDAKGQTVGVDVREFAGPALYSALGRDYSVVLRPSDARGLIDARPTELLVLEGRSLRAVSTTTLVLGPNADVGACALLDGALVVSAGSVATVVSLPVAPGAGEAPAPVEAGLQAPPQNEEAPAPPQDQ